MRVWLPFLISVVFVALAGFIAVEEPSQWPLALTVGSFFGLGAVVLGAGLWRDRSHRRSAAAPALVSVAGGVALPMRRWKLWLTAVSLLCVGGLGVFTGHGINPLYPWLSGLIAAVGVALAVGLALRRVGHSALRFEPEGLWLEHPRYRYLLPWDQLQATRGDIAGNACVSIYVTDVFEIAGTVESEDPARRERYRRKVLAKLRDGTVNLFPAQYGLDAVRLTEALQRYAADPTSRQQLRTGIPAPPG